MVTYGHHGTCPSPEVLTKALWTRKQGCSIRGQLELNGTCTLAAAKAFRTQEDSPSGLHLLSKLPHTPLSTTILQAYLVGSSKRRLNRESTMRTTRPALPRSNIIWNALKATNSERGTASIQ